jgi:hypothetical protein
MSRHGIPHIIQGLQQDFDEADEQIRNFEKVYNVGQKRFAKLVGTRSEKKKHLDKINE